MRSILFGSPGQRDLVGCDGKRQPNVTDELVNRNITTELATGIQCCG